MLNQNQVEARIATLNGKTRCRGPLSEAQVAAGAHACYRNAVSLIGDARAVAAGNPSRALSLTVLAFEELGKIPALFGLGPNADADRWRTFWKEEFSRHSFKQEEISGYGQALETARVGAYGAWVTDSMLNALDRLKQWGFYVDCCNGQFQSPQDLAAEFQELLDYFFLAAEERADSFAQFHTTPERSAWFLHEAWSANPKGGWPPPVDSEPVLRGVILSLAARHSRDAVPDYLSFYAACSQLVATQPTDITVLALVALLRLLEARATVSVLPSATARSWRMLKLLIGFVDQSSTIRARVTKQWTPRHDA